MVKVGVGLWLLQVDHSMANVGQLKYLVKAGERWFLKNNPLQVRERA